MCQRFFRFAVPGIRCYVSTDVERLDPNGKAKERSGPIQCDKSIGTTAEPTPTVELMSKEAHCHTLRVFVVDMKNLRGSRPEAFPTTNLG